MPSLQCQECGKELLRSNPTVNKDPCICRECGREVYGRELENVSVSCPSCGKTNKTKAVV
jgi:predicted RNA-binding Zn-ribbon protein involved in translation (DUF1610 family)